MAKEKNAGFQQAAGLIRYFDAEEETAIHINPKVVLAISFATSFIILGIGWIWPLR